MKYLSELKWVMGMCVLGVVTINFVEERRNKGVSRVYRKVIERSNSKELGSFIRETIDRKANIQVDSGKKEKFFQRCIE